MEDTSKQEIEETSQEQSIDDTALTKSAQLPHRIFMYSAFQKLVESTLSGDTNPEAPFHNLVQETLDSALAAIMIEMENDECFTVAEA